MNRFIILTFSLLVFAACAPTNASYAGHGARLGSKAISGKADSNVASSDYDPLKAHLLARAAVDPTGRKQNPYAYNYQNKKQNPVATPQDTQVASLSESVASGVTVGLSGVPFPVRKPVINGQFANAQTIEPVASMVSSSVQGLGGSMGIVPVPSHKPYVTASADNAHVNQTRSSGVMSVFPSRKPLTVGKVPVVENQSTSSINTGSVPVPSHKPIL